jgi:hypothetical protein
VARGGSLLYVGDGSDPYHSIREWWTGRYPTCAEHLAEALGDSERVRFVQANPASFTEKPAELLAAIRETAESAGHSWTPRRWLSVRRGPYVIAAGLEDAAETISGTFIDLLDPALPLVRDRLVGPGEMVWLRDLEYDAEPVFASAGRVRDFSEGRYVCEAPRGVDVVTALRAAHAPTGVLIDGAASTAWRHDSGVLWVRHPGAPGGTEVIIGW